MSSPLDALKEKRNKRKANLVFKEPKVSLESSHQQKEEVPEDLLNAPVHSEREAPISEETKVIDESLNHNDFNLIDVLENVGATDHNLDEKKTVKINDELAHTFYSKEDLLSLQNKIGISILNSSEKLESKMKKIFVFNAYCDYFTELYKEIMTKLSEQKSTEYLFLLFKKRKEEIFENFVSKNNNNMAFRNVIIHLFMIAQLSNDNQLSTEDGMIWFNGIVSNEYTIVKESELNYIINVCFIYYKTKISHSSAIEIVGDRKNDETSLDDERYEKLILRALSILINLKLAPNSEAEVEEKIFAAETKRVENSFLNSLVKIEKQELLKQQSEAQKDFFKKDAKRSTKEE
ncbi:hypothetical protein [Lactococcus lactis]|uniref:hypothetical protein n=1 Tax=Lactococcus lactis TaxID=1358 RepID=UPI00288E422E|nr:hypothetical protein [Lactococcus lactis]MDT2938660.1 hypothetical protein [Lactococcus lactis]